MGWKLGKLANGGNSVGRINLKVRRGWWRNELIRYAVGTAPVECGLAVLIPTIPYTASDTFTLCITYHRTSEYHVVTKRAYLQVRRCYVESLFSFDKSYLLGEFVQIHIQIKYSKKI